MTDIPKPGDRIELLSVPIDPDPIHTGARGTVSRVSGPHSFPQRGTWQIAVEWDDPKRSLMLCVPPDTYRIIERVTTDG